MYEFKYKTMFQFQMFPIRVKPKATIALRVFFKRIRNWHNILISDEATDGKCIVLNEESRCSSPAVQLPLYLLYKYMHL